eukprot:4314461-Prymnesium_polylepis.1
MEWAAALAAAANESPKDSLGLSVSDLRARLETNRRAQKALQGEETGLLALIEAAERVGGASDKLSDASAGTLSPSGTGQSKLRPPAWADGIMAQHKLKLEQHVGRDHGD